MRFLLATQNQHKAQEFAELFDRQVIDIQAAPLGLDVEESGKTYQENAYLKAKSYFDRFKAPVIADDSGLEVQALPGELGLYSARFGGAGLTDRDRSELLLQKLRGVTDRAASFVCHLCFIVSEQEVYFFEGRLQGMIAEELKGEKGFGYDPVFLPLELNAKDKPLVTLAECAEWKQRNSHRAVACHFAYKFFSERVCQIN